MKEIGHLFGVTSHVVGRTLKEIGLRWAWHEEKTVQALRQSGLKRTSGGQG